MPKTYLADHGTTIEIDCGEDISASTARAILIKMPDGIILDKVGSYVIDGVDGKIEWTDSNLEMNVKGKYYAQAKITFSATSIFFTETRSFIRYEAYK